MFLLALDKDDDGDIEFQFKQRCGSWYGKPAFPESTESYDICDYIGPDSIGFFIINGLEVDFLEESVDTWEDPASSYQEAKAAVKTLPVVNDGAERGVKISQKYLEDARKEEVYQNILQVAENDIKLVPNQRKRHIRIIK